LVLPATVLILNRLVVVEVFIIVLVVVELWPALSHFAIFLLLVRNTLKEVNFIEQVLFLSFKSELFFFSNSLK